MQSLEYVYRSQLKRRPSSLEAGLLSKWVILEQLQLGVLSSVDERALNFSTAITQSGCCPESNHKHGSFCKFEQSLAQPSGSSICLGYMVGSARPGTGICHC